MTHKLCQNAIFGDGGYHYSNWYPACTVEHYFQDLYCLEYMTRLAISRYKKGSHVILRFEEN